MNLWSVFLTGLLAGGASCAAVQGGLLAGVVARRSPEPPADPTADDGTQRTTLRRAPATVAAGSAVTTRTTRGTRSDRSEGVEVGPVTRSRRASGSQSRSGLDDIAPVGGFLVGKLVSHTLFGALLGLVGGAAQIGFRTRAWMQIGAGVLMLLLAANMLGVRSLQRLVPAAPPRIARLVRRTARSEATAAPALLGFLTVLIPCGVTLSVMFLAVASGSPVLGALGMAVFVLGTSPLFAILGYAVRRSADYLGGTLAKLAAVAVIVAGVLSINSGLVLGGSSVTVQSLWSHDDAAAPADSAIGAPVAAAGADASASENASPAAGAEADGIQRLVIDVRNTSYSPDHLRAKAGVPTELVLRTNGTDGCTRGFVIPSSNLQRILPPTGETTIKLGLLKPGRLNYTCSMGMYRGSIDVT